MLLLNENASLFHRNASSHTFFLLAVYREDTVRYHDVCQFYFPVLGTEDGSPYDVLWLLYYWFVEASNCEVVETSLSCLMHLKRHGMAHSHKPVFSLRVHLLHLVEHIEETHVGKPRARSDSKIAASFVKFETLLFSRGWQIVELEACVECFALNRVELHEVLYFALSENISIYDNPSMFVALLIIVWLVIMMNMIVYLWIIMNCCILCEVLLDVLLAVCWLGQAS